MNFNSSPFEIQQASKYVTVFRGQFKPQLLFAIITIST